MMPLTSSFPILFIIRGDIMEKIKVCPICNTEFTITDFKDARRKYCYTCSPSGRAGDYTPLYRAMKHQLILRKGGKCERCGYNKCEAVLQFHHRNPKEKKFELAIRSNSHSWEEWQEEANKCELLCANCHAEEHYMG